MPLPFILGAAMAVAAVGGIGSGIHGASKMKEANDTMKLADSIHKRNIQRFEDTNEATVKATDELGKLELEILESFKVFSNTIEKIQNRPEFKEYNKDDIELPKYDKEELNTVSVIANSILAGLGGAAVGTAGGIAAAGATTTVVMALGTASTGTAIASLSGAAATNATLAALGGGAIAAGGGGIALGTTILGATTLGVGLLVGGVIFNITGSKLSDKADEAWNQMKKAEKTIDIACTRLNELKSLSIKYKASLTKVYDKYKEIFKSISYTVNILQKTDWNYFSLEEKIATEITVLLVCLLYKMCKVGLVTTTEEGDNSNKEINNDGINKSIEDANIINSL